VSAPPPDSAKVRLIAPYSSEVENLTKLALKCWPFRYVNLRKVSFAIFERTL
jgi:hypothetical protein